MLDIKYIREHAELVKQNNKARGVTVDVDHLLQLDHEWRNLLGQIEKMRSTRKQGSKGKPSEQEIAAMRQLGDDIARLEGELTSVEADFTKLLKTVPNLTHPEVPTGGEEDFKVLKTQGQPSKFKFQPKDHEELMLALGVLDLERGAKTTGTKFYFAKNDLVRLNQALIQYGTDVLSKHGFTLMETPDLARDEILEGIGFNPRGPESQVYSILGHDLSLIGTAEITLGGYHANEILDLSAGPLKYAGISHCFRTEAGAYGRTSKGLYRVHQFTKLEMFVYCKPEDSEQLHQALLAIEQEIVDGLGLPYQVIDTASCDLGAPAYRKFDIEAWMVMKNGYGEITSTSNCTDYQARRLNVRYRKENGETDFVHTLNGTAVVTSRLPIAIFENFQTENGTVKIPKVLQQYMGGLKEIKPKK